MQRLPELLPDAIFIIIAGIAASVIVGILLRTDRIVPWHFWAAVVGIWTYICALIGSLWWYNQWKGKR